MRAIFLAVLLLTAVPALSQPAPLQAVDPSVQSATPPTDRPEPVPQGQPAQAPGVPAGGADVQSAAPEVGAGRGDAAPNASGANTGQPASSDPQRPTGAAPTALPRPAAPQDPGLPPMPRAPMNARGDVSAEELELQRIREGGVVDGRVSIPNQSAGILIQPEGRDWRQFRTRVLTIGGLAALAIAVLALAIFFTLRGPTRIDAGRSGRKVLRFTLTERVTHWMVAVSFVLLALTGLNITYGAYVLRPLIGPEAFTTLTLWGQAVHQYLAFAFLLGILIMLVRWAGQNIPRRVDWEWIRAGGPLAKSHPPAGKFNAAQKALYWLSMLAGLALSVTGILLMAPYLLDNVTLQQWAHVAHGLLAMGMIAMILGHIYIGTIGMEGAFEGMRDGEVDYNWAREHHSAWLAEEVANARRTVAPDAVPGRTAGAD